MEQSDIVERLNEGAAHCGMCGAQAVEKNSRDQYICTACLHEVRPDYAHVLRWEAAAEITRLRAALAEAVPASQIRAEALREAAALADKFHWQLPMFASAEMNAATDDAACAVSDQIARAILARVDAPKVTP